jgi:hypothetical protein
MHKDESTEQLAQRVLPSGAILMHVPQVIDFGADTEGILLIFKQPHPKKIQYWIWYLSPQYSQSVYHKVIVKSPQPMDSNFDLQVNQVFSVGPEGAKDLVLLEGHSLPLTAGGERQLGGSVYRRIQLHAQLLEEASSALDGVTTKALALEKLDPWIAKIPAPKPGSLIDYFLSVPLEYLPTTRLERWELIKPESQRLLLMDAPNGFAQIAGDGGLPGYVLGLFKSSEQGYVFALQTRWTRGQQTLFFSRSGNHWVDVSKDILPDYRETKEYKIPHKGRELELYSPDGDIDTVYRWNGHKFEPSGSGISTE